MIYLSWYPKFINLYLTPTNIYNIHFAACCLCDFTCLYHPSIDTIHLTSSSENLETAILVGNVPVTALFSEVRRLGNATFIHKPIDYQNGESGTVAACDVCARGQYTASQDFPPSLLVIICPKYSSFFFSMKLTKLFRS